MIPYPASNSGALTRLPSESREGTKSSWITALFVSGESVFRICRLFVPANRPCNKWKYWK